MDFSFALSLVEKCIAMKNKNNKNDPANIVATSCHGPQNESSVFVSECVNSISKNIQTINQLGGLVFRNIDISNLRKSLINACCRYNEENVNCNSGGNRLSKSNCVEWNVVGDISQFVFDFDTFIYVDTLPVTVTNSTKQDSQRLINDIFKKLSV